MDSWLINAVQKIQTIVYICICNINNIYLISLSDTMLHGETRKLWMKPIFRRRIPTINWSYHTATRFLLELSRVQRIKIILKEMLRRLGLGGAKCGKSKKNINRMYSTYVRTCVYKINKIHITGIAKGLHSLSTFCLENVKWINTVCVCDDYKINDNDNDTIMNYH